MESLSVILCLAGAVFLVALLMISFSIRVVPNGRRMAVYRLGQYLGIRVPGL